MAKKKKCTALAIEQDEEFKWESEDDLRCLKRLTEINKDPARVKRLKKFIQSEKEDIKVIDEEYLKQIGLKKG